MKPSILLGRFNIDKDETLLTDLVNYFNQVDLPYKLDQSDVTTIIELYQKNHLSEANAFIKDWRKSKTQETEKDQWQWLKSFYVSLIDGCLCLIIAIICLFCFYHSLFNEWQFISLLTFQEFNDLSSPVLPNSFDTILNIFVDGHLWRIFTPIFLHFDWFEIIIGLIPFIYLGRQVEMNEGKWFFIVAILFLSAVSHICHFYVASHLIISGISCVNLGLVAYIGISKTYPIDKTYDLTSWAILLTGIVLLIDIWQSPYLLTAYIGSTLSGIALVFTQQHLLTLKNRKTPDH